MAKILVKERQTVITTKNKLRDWGFIGFSAERGKSSVYEFLWDTKHKNTTSSIKNFTEHTEETKISSASETKTFQHNTEISSKYPSWETFLCFAQAQKTYRPELEAKLKEKYEHWQQNNWTSVQGKPIIDWKQTIKNVLPFLDKPSFVPQLPKIQHPKLPLDFLLKA